MLSIVAPLWIIAFATTVQAIAVVAYYSWQWHYYTRSDESARIHRWRMNQETEYPEDQGTFIGDYTDPQEYADYAEEEPVIPIPPPETPPMDLQDEVSWDQGIANIVEVIRQDLMRDVDRLILHEVHSSPL